MSLSHENVRDPISLCKNTQVGHVEAILHAHLSLLYMRCRVWNDSAIRLLDRDWDSAEFWCCDSFSVRPTNMGHHRAASFFFLLLPFFLFCPLWEHGLVRCVNRTFFTLGIGRVNWSSLFPRGSIMYEEQIKLKAYSPWSRLVKESKSSALVPHIYEFSVDRLVHR